MSFMQATPADPPLPQTLQGGSSRARSIVHVARGAARRITTMAALLAALAVSGCDKPSASRETASQNDGRLEIVCTTGMVADLVRNVGGEHVRVGQLMGEGVDPHLYKASPGDVRVLSRADMIFYSGLHLEGTMADVLKSLARRKPTFAVTAKLEETSPDRLLEVGEDYYDPHIWFDVSLWSEAAEYVGEVLAEADPDHAEDYRRNLEQYRDELSALHEYAREQIASIPEPQRVLVTAHDAFHYFGRAYGIEVEAIQGVSTESEAGVRKINELVDFLAERKIRAVFVETSVSDRNIRSLLEGASRRGHTVTIGGSLYSDAMGVEGTPEGTYVGMVRHNVDTIVSALK